MTDAIDEWERAIADYWAVSDALTAEEGVAAMEQLAAACPARDGRASFELAGALDSFGFEERAAGEYERAIQLGLDAARSAQTAVQYGSTLRNLGRFEEALQVLQAAPEHESTGVAPQLMLALTLHSCGRKDEALRVALEAQIASLPQYQRSMRAYAAALSGSPTE